MMMSLWEVSDDATQKLTTEFYNQIAVGTGLHEAFVSSQKKLRQMDGGKYDEPRFWAAFIMLDALN